MDERNTDALVDKVKEHVDHAIDATAEFISDARERAAQLAGEAMRHAEDLEERVAEKAGDILDAAADRAEIISEKTSEAASHIREQASQAAVKAGEFVKGAAQAVEEKAEVLAGQIAQAKDKVVEKVKNAWNGRVTDRKVIELHGVSIYQMRDTLAAGRGSLGELVLSDVDFSVSPGEMVYFIGKVGSGKSTLLKTLYAEVPLSVGQATIVDCDLRKLRRRDIPLLRRKIGVVFQDYQLLPDRNAYHNLRYVMKATGWKDEAQIRKRIDEVIGLVGLKNKEYKMPFELSGGEQQRLAIARALVNNPQVILADEPTGNLDPASAEGIMKLFRQIVETGCAIVMSTHNISNIQFFPSRTIRFAQGRMEQINIHSILGISE